MALKTEGEPATALIPITPIIVNHIIISGPKNFPISEVPALCIIKSKIIITSTIWITGRLGKEGFNPSMAEETEMGGVIILSANKKLPPASAGNNNHFL